MRSASAYQEWIVGIISDNKLIGSNGSFATSKLVTWGLYNNQFLLDMYCTNVCRTYRVGFALTSGTRLASILIHVEEQLGCITREGAEFEAGK